MEVLFVPLAFFALTFGIVYFAITTRHKERIKLIESGADPEMFKSPTRKGRAIRIGFLLIGVGVGLFVGNIIGTLTVIKAGIAIPSMILLFGGALLLVGNKMANDVEDKDENKNV